MSATPDPSTLTFLMVGCERCGTTWVDAALREHPEVYLPPQKQTYFFDRHYDEGADWYLENFRDVGPEHKAVGEVATGYCLVEAIPRMAALLPHVKLIMCVRNPVERAYSYYLTRRQERSWRSFDQAIDEHEQLLSRGRYMEQLDCLLEHYPRDQILLLFYEDLAADDRAFLARILEFVGLDPSYESPMFGQTRNAAIFPRLRHTLNSVGLRPVLKTLSRSPVGTVVRKVNNRSGKKHHRPMDPAVQGRLLDYYRPWTERLAEFADRDLGAWKGS